MALISLRSAVALVGLSLTLGGVGGCWGQTLAVVGWVFTTAVEASGSYAWEGVEAIFAVHVDRYNVCITVFPCRTMPSVQIVGTGSTNYRYITQYYVSLREAEVFSAEAEAFTESSD